MMVKKFSVSKFMLLDFDWAGEIWKVTYPPNVNVGPGLRCPDGAFAGALVLAEHDINMLGLCSGAVNNVTFVKSLGS